MGRKKTPGLIRRGEIWHINKVVLGKPIRCSTGETQLEEAERRLNEEVRKVRNALVYGQRSTRSFSLALTMYCEERGWNPTDEYHCKLLNAACGDLALEEIHMGTLTPRFVQPRLDAGMSKKTVNNGLQVARAVLRRAAGEWIDELGLTWLNQAPTIKLLEVDDKKKPYPPNWEEQRRLLPLLPDHYQSAALYVVNTGLRDQVACSLEWEWEREVPELNGTVFIVPPEVTGVKNGQEWIIVHNRIAQSVIEAQRGKHDRFVFPGRDNADRMHRINNKAWRKAWKDAGLPAGPQWRKGPHNLRHAFSGRLRALGVPDETRDYLMHHKRDGDMSALYSIPTLKELQKAVEKLCDADDIGATVLRLIEVKSTKSAQGAATPCRKVV